MHISPPLDTGDGYQEATFRFHGRALTLRYPHDYTEPHLGVWPTTCKAKLTAFGCAMSLAYRALVLDEDNVPLPRYWEAWVVDERLCA